MLTRWLTFTAFLVGSVDPERAPIGRGSLTVAPTCRVKGHPEAELTLNCGDGKNAGVVQYWHTPFGDFQTPGFHSKLDPVFMHPDGSLVVPNTSILHSGMYYCLLHHTEGTTLWRYELLVGPDSQYKQRDAFRFRRDVGSVEETQAGVSDGQFAGAVAASVVLTFVVGFSAGALTRTHVLRCLGAVTSRLRSPRQRRCHGPEVSVTTLPPMYDNQAFEMEQVLDDDDSARCATMETTSSSSTTSPPAKPQRSFRQKRQEQETTAYLEGCDYMKEEEEARRHLEEKNKGCDEEEEEKRESSGFYLLGEDGGSQTETEEDGEEKDGRESREEKEQRLEEEEVEEADEQNRNKERRESEEEEKGRDEKREEEVDEQEIRNKERRGGVEGEKGRDEKSEEVEDGEKTKREEDGETDDETESNKEEDTMKNGVVEGGGETSPSPGRRSRVIRLYQYDEDGQRYGHLPDPAPHQAGPAPRLKQRSLSLTRLNAIMATASAGPLDTGVTGREEKEERPHFHMEI